MIRLRTKELNVKEGGETVEVNDVGKKEDGFAEE